MEKDMKEYMKEYMKEDKEEDNWHCDNFKEIRNSAISLVSGIITFDYRKINKKNFEFVYVKNK